MSDDSVVPLPEDLSQPAQRALAGASIANLADVTRYYERDIAGLHGVGPKTIRQLRAALTRQGWTFADQDRSTSDGRGSDRAEP